LGRLVRVLALLFATKLKTICKLSVTCDGYSEAGFFRGFYEEIFLLSGS
jgi:hypothetical protein